jgi:membrane AbrB-like protein
MQTKLLSVIKMYVISISGGLLFYYFNLPLPWILGPMTTILLWKIVMKQHLSSPKVLRDTGFVILGIFFGLFFTIDTLHTVLPYFFPYLLSTILLVTISVINGIWISKFIDLESMTSVIGTVPGGLSQMVAVADDLDANVAMVTILQTVRLLTVVFFVPFTVVQLFSGGPTEIVPMTSTAENASIFHLNP